MTLEEFVELTSKIDVMRVIDLARMAVMSSTGFASAWEFGDRADGEAIHEQLRAALGIGDEEWRDSPDR